MKTYIESFLELLYPEKNTCFICDIYDESIGDKYICSSCEGSIKKLVPPLCTKCSKPIDYNMSVLLCPDCINDIKYFESSKSPFLYDGLIKNSIYSFKYYNKPYYYKLFGKLLIDYMININYINFDYIISVPLHSTKMKKRGYNQSELVAKYISSNLNIPYLNALKRVKRTIKQSQKSKEDRRKNLKNAFSINNTKNINKIKNSSVLIVDDVYTTGSTTNECSKTLINFGVNKVNVITIAR